MARPRSLGVKILLLLVASVWNGRTTDALVVILHNLAASPAHLYKHEHQEDVMAADQLAPAPRSPSTKVQKNMIGEPILTGRLLASANSSSVTSLAAVVVVAAAAAAFAGLILLSSNPLAALAFEGEDVIVGTPLEPVILQMGSASYPVFASINDISPLSNKLVSLFEKKMSVSKATEALDKGIDSFLAIPEDKVEKFVTTLRSSYQGVVIVVVSNDETSSSSSNCSPQLTIPTTSLGQWAGSLAVQALDPTKV
jgi:hypothetical protein